MHLSELGNFLRLTAVIAGLTASSACANESPLPVADIARPDDKLIPYIPPPLTLPTPEPPTTSQDIANNVFEAFRMAVADPARQDDIVGLFVPHLLGVQVTQQPSDNPVFVSDYGATEFMRVREEGGLALLAHNHLAGDKFDELNLGDTASIIFGSGSVQSFQVSAIEEFRAQTPTSVHSNFDDLSDRTEAWISAGALFDQIYGQAGRLVLQTCIANDTNGDGRVNTSNELSYGRLFVILEPEQE